MVNLFSWHDGGKEATPKTSAEKKIWSRDSSNRIAWTEFRDVCKKVPEDGEWFVPILGCTRNLVNGYQVGYNLVINGIY